MDFLLQNLPFALNKCDTRLTNKFEGSEMNEGDEDNDHQEYNVDDFFALPQKIVRRRMKNESLMTTKPRMGVCRDSSRKQM